ncbi:hypothetical protein [Dactylosporangium sp. NPDC000521]|uniref:hypothetical protein n=1 Tax=Dactylosporangium sp. NPDC000521 TaxID=3363975 RepID=UPI00367F6B22
MPSILPRPSGTNQRGVDSPAAGRSPGGQRTGLLEAATFRCAGVDGPGSRVTAEPWYAEVREAFAAYAAEPDDWTGEDFLGWGRRGVTDRRVKALGSAGPAIYDEDRAMAMTIAFAPAELIADPRLLEPDVQLHTLGLVPHDRDPHRDGRAEGHHQPRTRRHRLIVMCRDLPAVSRRESVSGGGGRRARPGCSPRRGGGRRCAAGR